MSITKIIKLLLPIMFYEVFVGIFLIQLNKSNIFLSEEYSNASFMDLLQYNEWEPVKYFGITVVLGVIGWIGILFCLNMLKNSHTDEEEMVAYILSMVLYAATMFTTIFILSKYFHQYSNFKCSILSSYCFNRRSLLIW